jgi:hypothetical protein
MTTLMSTVHPYMVVATKRSWYGDFPFYGWSRSRELLRIPARTILGDLEEAWLLKSPTRY